MTGLPVPQLPKITYSNLVPFNLYPRDLKFRIGHRGLSRRPRDNQEMARLLRRAPLRFVRRAGLASRRVAPRRSFRLSVRPRNTEQTTALVRADPRDRDRWRRLNSTTPPMLIPFIPLKGTVTIWLRLCFELTFSQATVNATNAFYRWISPWRRDEARSFASLSHKRLCSRAIKRVENPENRVNR